MSILMKGDQFSAYFAWAVTNELLNYLNAACEKITIAGSYRRGHHWVGDLELLYIPKHDEAKLPGEMFAQPEQNLADLAIANLIAAGVLEKRLNAKGAEMFGDKNKLVRHVKTGLPVDLFATTAECWENYLVCRTGGVKTNLAICQAAQRKGWTWHPYGTGFSRKLVNGEERYRVTAERQVFEFVGLQYPAPSERE